MKTKLVLFISLSLATTFVLAAKLWRGESMSLAKVSQRWGTTELNLDIFKNGSEKDRAAMAADLLKKSNLFVGKGVLEIREIFGPHDGFYFTDIFPAYLIESSDDPSKDAWQLVFLLDKTQKVREIVVQKN